MFHRIMFILLIVSGLSCNFNRCAVSFQSVMNIACRRTENENYCLKKLSNLQSKCWNVNFSGDFWTGCWGHKIFFPRLAGIRGLVAKTDQSQASHKLNWTERDFDLSLDVNASSETQGQSVGSGGQSGGTKVFITGERAPGYRLSLDHFQEFKRMPAPDWAQKMLCIIVPNRRTHLNEFFSCVRTWRLLSRSLLV